MVSHSSFPLPSLWALCLDVATGPGLILEPDLPSLRGWGAPGATQPCTATTLALWAQGSRAFSPAVGRLWPHGSCSPVPCLHLMPQPVTGDAAVPSLVFTGPENKSQVCGFFK